MAAEAAACRPDSAVFLDGAPAPAPEVTTCFVARYPAALRDAGVSGEAIVDFLVDSLGTPHVDSFRIVSATHQGFADAVREAVAMTRFRPVERSGRPVAARLYTSTRFTLERVRQPPSAGGVGEPAS